MVGIPTATSERYHSQPQHDDAGPFSRLHRTSFVGLAKISSNNYCVSHFQKHLIQACRGSVRVIPVQPQSSVTIQEHHRMSQARPDHPREKPSSPQASQGQPRPSRTTQGQTTGHPKLSTVTKGHRRPSKAKPQHPRPGGYEPAGMRNKFKPSLVNHQIRDAATIEMLLHIHHAYQHNVDHIHLAGCWISLGRLSKR